MIELYWRVKQAEEKLPCECGRITLQNQIYFLVERDNKYLHLCVACFIEVINNEIAILKGKIQDYESIKGKCLIAKEEYYAHHTTDRKEPNQ